MQAEIYTKDSCIWCRRAKELLTEHQIEIVEFTVSNRNDLDSLEVRTGKKITTVPQIFLDGKHIGGYDALEVFLRIV